MTPEILSNEIFIELLKSGVFWIISLILLFLFILFLGISNNKSSDEKCIICGKTNLPDEKFCKDCNFRIGG